MLIDTELLFDELVGYEFYHECEVKAVIDDKVKCLDGEVLDFFDVVEFIIEEYDEIIILRKRETIEELNQAIQYLKEENDHKTVAFAEEEIKKAQKTGLSVTYACIHDDTFYELHSFSF